MKTQYTMATIADYNELLELANDVFGFDFLKRLPKLYKKDYEKAPCHYIIKEDGRIKSIVGFFPMEMNAAGEKLKVGGIGTVSVHPDSRRKGYMKALMKQAMEDMKQLGVDLACLSGNRQRYAYFGFEPCGPMLKFQVFAMNLYHVFGDNKITGITLSKVESDDNAALAVMRALHSAQPNTVTRSAEEYYDILCSWNSVPYGVYRREELVGYLVSSADYGEVCEMVLKDDADVCNVVREFFYHFGHRETNFLCELWQNKLIAFLESVAERYNVHQNQNFAVLNYQNVLRAMFKLKATYAHLTDGELTLCVEGMQSLKITVKDGQPSVEPYAGECDMTLAPLLAMRCLFSPIMNIFDFGIHMNSATRQWFPLPLYYPKLDQV